MYIKSKTKSKHSVNGSFCLYHDNSEDDVRPHLSTVGFGHRCPMKTMSYKADERKKTKRIFRIMVNILCLRAKIIGW